MSSLELYELSHGMVDPSIINDDNDMEIMAGYVKNTTDTTHSVPKSTHHYHSVGIYTPL